MQEIKFWKMQGLGNNYIYLNCLESQPADPSDLAKKISNQNFGIGSDGLVLILPSEKYDYRMQMLNADGSEAEMCGNAVRCIAKFLYDLKITDQKEINLETLAGKIVLNLKVSENNTVEEVSVNMGKYILDPKKIPVNLDATEVINYPYNFFGEEYLINTVSMGNPHLIIFTDKITDQQILELGPKLEKYDIFPNKINVEFVKVIDKNTLEMRVWERGTGETLACGTGACAVAVAAKLNNLTNDQVTVKLPGGDLKIEILANNEVVKTGPAEFIAEGKFYY